MNGQFRLTEDVETQDVGIATLRWICHPASTAAEHMTVAEATFARGQGHGFHQHPDQDLGEDGAVGEPPADRVAGPWRGGAGCGHGGSLRDGRGVKGRDAACRRRERGPGRDVLGMSFDRDAPDLNEGATTLG